MLLKSSVLLLLSLSGFCNSQCLPGYVQTPTGMCISVNPAALDFDAAEAACSANGGHLVSVHSIFDNRFLCDRVRNMSIQFVYFGMRDINQNGNYQWIDGTPVDYTAWCPGYPIPSTANDYCLMVYLTSDECWQNTDCAGRNASVCAQGSGIATTTIRTTSPVITTTPTVGPNSTCANISAVSSEGCPANWFRFQDYCYTSADVYNTWQNAETYCIGQGGHLASVWSMEENRFIRDFLKVDYLNGHLDPNGNYLLAFIGLQLNSPQWTDGSPVNFTNYRTELTPEGSCVFMFTCGIHQEGGGGDGDDISGMWRGWDCNARFRQAVCKKNAATTR